MVRIAAAVGLLVFASPALSASIKDKFYCVDYDLAKTSEAKSCVNYLRSVGDRDCVNKGKQKQHNDTPDPSKDWAYSPFCTLNYSVLYGDTDKAPQTKKCGEIADKFDELIDKCSTDKGTVGGTYFYDTSYMLVVADWKATNRIPKKTGGK